MQPINIIRDLYPSPVRADYFSWGGTYREGAYCVGGALCLFYAKSRGIFPVLSFPTTHGLRDALRVINPRLTATEALSCAVAIQVNNDAGHFDDAWAAANNALTHK